MRPETIYDVIDDLGLGDFNEDWGIVNGSAARLPEFVEYFERHHGQLDDDVHPDLLELILSSADDVVLTGGDAEAARRLVERALATCKRGEATSLAVRYWLHYWRDSDDPRIAAFRAALLAFRP